MSLTVALGDACRYAAALSSRGASSPSSSPTSWGGTVKSARGARVPWPRVADARGRNIGSRRSVFSPRAGPREFHSSFFLFYTLTFTYGAAASSAVASPSSPASSATPAVRPRRRAIKPFPPGYHALPPARPPSSGLFFEFPSPAARSRARRLPHVGRRAACAGATSAYHASGLDHSSSPPPSFATRGHSVLKRRSGHLSLRPTMGGIRPPHPGRSTAAGERRTVREANRHQSGQARTSSWADLGGPSPADHGGHPAAPPLRGVTSAHRGGTVRHQGRPGIHSGQRWGIWGTLSSRNGGRAWGADMGGGHGGRASGGVRPASGGPGRPWGICAYEAPRGLLIGVNATTLGSPLLRLGWFPSRRQGWGVLGWFLAPRTTDCGFRRNSVRTSYGP